MTEIWVLMLVGQYREPFLEAALRSVDWADGFSVVNTDPEGGRGQENETMVRRIIPRNRLQVTRLTMSRLNFAQARNAGLAVIPDGAYAMITDADDVHWPTWGEIARSHVAFGNHLSALLAYVCVQEPLALAATSRDPFPQGVRRRVSQHDGPSP